MYYLCRTMHIVYIIHTLLSIKDVYMIYFLKKLCNYECKMKYLL